MKIRDQEKDQKDFLHLLILLQKINNNAPYISIQRLRNQLLTMSETDSRVTDNIGTTGVSTNQQLNLNDDLATPGSQLLTMGPGNILWKASMKLNGFDSSDSLSSLGLSRNASHDSLCDVDGAFESEDLSPTPQSLVATFFAMLDRFLTNQG